MEDIYKKENTLFVISAVISITVWLAVIAGTLGIALIYLLFFFISYLFAQSAFISYIKGTAVEVTPTQMPGLNERIVDCCNKLGISEVPAAYVLNGDGILNALATRFLGRHYLVLYSDVVDALDAHPDSLNFYIGHELGHIHRKHLKWVPILFPSSVLPLLGTAYSRAREYTCDLYGVRCSEKPVDAALALGVLAAGTSKWSKINLNNYAAQTDKTGGFWMSFHELISDYPWLVKRMAYVAARAKGEVAVIPRRNPFSWLFALFIPRLGFGGSASGIIAMVAVIGILAAIAIPSFNDYRMRANASAAVSEADELRDQISDYIVTMQAFPENLEAIGLAEDFSTRQIAGVTLTEQNEMVVLLKGNQQYTIVYIPRIEDGKLLWSCSEGTLPSQFRPQHCR